MEIQTFSSCPLLLCVTMYLSALKTVCTFSLLVSSHLGHQLSAPNVTKGQSHFPAPFRQPSTTLLSYSALPCVSLLSPGGATNAATWVYSGISHEALNPFYHPSQSSFLLKCRHPAFKAFLFSWINHFFRPCSLFLLTWPLLTDEYTFGHILSPLTLTHITMCFGPLILLQKFLLYA